MCYFFDFKFVVFRFLNHFKFCINLVMKIHQNFHVKGIFHHDKSNRLKCYACICLVGLFFRLVELCSTRNQCICFHVVLCFCLYLIQNIQEDSNKIKKVTTCQNFKIDGLSLNESSKRFYL